MWIKAKTLVRKGVVALPFAVAAGSSFAVSPFDPITEAVTFVEVTAAIMAIAAILASLYVVIRGVKNVLGMIRRG